VVGVDLSPDALALARENARSLGLDVPFVEGSMRAGLRGDAVLANLPYVAQGDPLAPEIERYEPACAVFSGSDGLSAIRELCGQLDGVAFVGLEHGFGQGPAVAALVRAAGFTDVSTLRDLAGHERVTVGRRSAAPPDRRGGDVG
jgi:release factor glutamine methyltransferase